MSTNNSTNSVCVSASTDATKTDMSVMDGKCRYDAGEGTLYWKTAENATYKQVHAFLEEKFPEFWFDWCGAEKGDDAMIFVHKRTPQEDKKRAFKKLLSYKPVVMKA